jgi:hypothetical protein
LPSPPGIGLAARAPERIRPRLFLNDVAGRRSLSLEDVLGTSKTKADRLERFLTKVRVNRRGCWVWQGWRSTAQRQPLLKVNRRWLLAHRVAYVLARGDLPAAIALDRTCQNMACVRPEHLRPRKMLAKPTRPPNPNFRKLRPLVSLIRARVAAGDKLQDVAGACGCNISSISLIARHKIYRDVPDEEPRAHVG